MEGVQVIVDCESFGQLHILRPDIIPVSLLSPGENGGNGECDVFPVKFPSSL